MIAALRLPFRALDNIELRRWIRMASFARKPPEFLRPKDVREGLQTQVEIGREKTLALLSPAAKISLAVDCWTSPNKLAFMAITG